MWREWTSKIKNFAENITTPDYDEEQRYNDGENDRDDVVENRVEDSHSLSLDERCSAHYRGDFSGTHATAHGHSNCETTYGDGDRFSVLKTSAQRLGLQCDELSVDRHAGAGGNADAAVYTQASPVSAEAAPSLSLSPSPLFTVTALAGPLGSVGQTMASADAVVVTLGSEAAQRPSGSSGDRAVATPSAPSLGSAQAGSTTAAEHRGTLLQSMVTSSSRLSTVQAQPLQRLSSFSSCSAALPSLPAQQGQPQEQTQPQPAPGLEAERAHLSGMHKYEHEVRATCARTVPYSEGKLRESAATIAVAAGETATWKDANAPLQVDALRAAHQVMVDELKGEVAHEIALGARVRKLQQQAAELPESLAAAEEDTDAMKVTAAAAASAVSAAAKTPDAASLLAEDDWRPCSSEALESLKEEVHEKRTQLQSTEVTRRFLPTPLQEAQTEVMASITTSCDTSANGVREEHQCHRQLQGEADRLICELEEKRHCIAATQELLLNTQPQKEEPAAQVLNKHEFSKSTPAAVEGTSLSASAQAAHEEERQRLVDKLTHGEAERGALQQEVKQLTETAAQLQQRLEAREHEYAASLAAAQAAQAESQKALLAKLNAVETQMSQSRHTCQEELQHMQAQLEGEQRRAKVLEMDTQAAQHARAAAEEQAAAAEQRGRSIQAEFEAFQQQVKQRMAESEGKQSDADVSVTVLAQVKKQLESKVQTLEAMVDQVRRMSVDTLVRLGVDVEHILPMSLEHKGDAGRAHPGGDDEEDADKEDEKGGAATRTELPLLQLFSLLITESLQQHSVVWRAERVQQEWEQTYEQARQVNDSLNQQLADAWSTIGKLREELSVKEEVARQVHSRLVNGDARLVEAEGRLASAVNEMEKLREERGEWAAQLRQAETHAEDQENAVSSLQEEVRTLQEMLQAKEEELQASLQGNENLQVVLERFQENQRHDVESLTLESQLEAEELKKQLAAARRITNHHEKELAEVRRGFERQLAEKDAEVTTMHRKLAEVRKALEKTTSQYMDGSETCIDKRVVSQLLAKYMHAFIEQRKEAEDMLKVISGLLDWDEATQEFVGLLPGPNNPQPPDGFSSQRGGARRSLFRWLRSSADTSVAHSGGTPGTSKAGLASMWVEFLLKESEGSGGGGRSSRREGGTSAFPLASTTPSSITGSQPNPSFNFPSPPAAAATETPEAATNS
ncbi:conserved hypothetical protein [Leishmania braziliensis MHOM/BR/75/M2904]|uniref:GRIP domain-containing protein n=2 Tax=Leishmania braziliensis TaxID=5660 RepID=A4HLX8_LEIBR|nr:conserved hypothetical protein [Leishmania braziliensis MHOM/BR/75/M2904]CAJ2479678.1 unnamed protein product [Leishmania braziliensis]CAM40827.1 conserved hypothetical protein [Leishmania braziliensis MHOM/BR/75/M2904]SYZ69238.1 hypothetical_protein [Leishmania braziliensis MHOM/BR/75/M2904]